MVMRRVVTPHNSLDVSCEYISAKRTVITRERAFTQETRTKKKKAGKEIAECLGREAGFRLDPG